MVASPSSGDKLAIITETLGSCKSKRLRGGVNPCDLLLDPDNAGVRNLMNAPESNQIALIGPILDPTFKKTKIITHYPQIAVDGGILFSNQPVLWLGDGDSGVDEGAALSLTMKPSQDQTDLAFAMAHIRMWRWTQLHLYGFLGKRKDHELANFGEVYHALKTRFPESRATFYNHALQPAVVLLSAGTHTLMHEGLFSLFTFEKNWISLTGDAEYLLSREELLPFSGRGVSNQAHGAIRIECMSPVMVVLSAVSSEVEES